MNSSPSGDDRSIHPVAARLGVLPARGVQRGQLAERGGGHVGVAPLDLVPLSRVVEVLEQQGEPRLGGIERGEQEAGHPGGHPGRHLGVEPHLDLVGPHHPAGVEALLVLRGELADDAGRTRAVRLVGEAEAHGVRHLPGAHRRRRHPDHPGAVGQATPGAQHGGQPRGRRRPRRSVGPRRPRRHPPVDRSRPLQVGGRPVEEPLEVESPVRGRAGAAARRPWPRTRRPPS